MNDDGTPLLTNMREPYGDTELDHLDLEPELNWDPMRIVPPEPWVGHIPFAFWLIKALRPNSLVELGTHSGNSYFAFCQALARFCPGARSFAVDTWRGDEHAGHYDDDVFRDVNAFNHIHFSQFSTLLRTTFDDARQYFATAEIDLLHIDGMHSYDSVKHDFENWKSAVSAKGVVIFHDTNVRERDFGVWRLWKELSETYPAFEFTHSNGLGVLALGADQTPLMRQLFAMGGDAQASVRRRIARRGETFQRQVEAQALRCQIEGLTQQIENLRALDAEIGWRDVVIAERSATISAKDDLVKIYQNLAAARSASIAARDAVILARENQIMHMIGQAKDYEARIADLVAQAAAAQPLVAATLAEASRNVVALQDQLDKTVQSYVNSTSWKLTRPLRVATRLARSRRLRPAAASQSPGSALPAPLEAAGPVSTPDVTAVTPLKAAMRGMLMARLEAFLSGTARLRLPRSDTPAVSVLLVLFNQAELTFGCLGSILETLGEQSVEVVIIDNASSDLTPALLDRIDGATIIRNPSNLHFLKAVNLGAKSAGGRNLLLLNNDAQLLPDAVASALRTLESAPDIGAVGGRIILPDGTLQEAGSIIWRDGACSGYGRGADPANPDFMFQRDVDYCSGAFLLTPMKVFNAMGGFDERFAPAYYEETDYCVRLWESGRRVVYDPDAAIIHYEFGSASGASALALQANNHKIFAAQHAEWLARQFEPSPANVFVARNARSAQPRILVLEDRVPKIELGTGYPRSNRLLHELVATGAQVTLFPMFRHRENWQGVRRALDKRIEILILAESSEIRAYLSARRGYFDAILVCRPHNMETLLNATGPERDLLGDAKIIYDAEALFVTRALQQMAAQGQPASDTERHRLNANEVTLTRLADAVISVSAAERDILEDYGAKEVYLLGHAIDDTPLATGFEARDEIVFLGAIPDDAAPNADAVRWFAAEILPEIRSLLGRDLCLTVVGRVRAASVEALEAGQITLTGMVDKLAPALARARILVVPTRFAAGIPHKVHQAAMLGIPMVVTDLINEQLGWDAGSDVLVASDAAAFAKACAQLYTDPALWERVRGNALRRATADCDPKIFTATIRKIVSEIPLTRKRPAALHDARDEMPERRPTEPADPQEPQTSRPAETDFALAVPFDYRPRKSSPRVAVICHMFYPALAPEVLFYLRHLPVPADLLITTDTEDKRKSLEAVFSKWENGAVEIKTTPNRGRDIAPKLIAWAERYANYDLVLHLHSKVSDHADFLTNWRSFLFENLAGSTAVIESIFDAFERLPDLGMVASQHYEAIRRWLGWNGNFEQAQQFANRMGISLSPLRALDFPSGSMFWARPAALQPLLDLELSFDAFPQEGSQVDETPAHAIERLYFHACERAGLTWVKVGQRALFMDSTRIVPVPSPEALSRFIGEYAVMLSGPSEIAKLTEPAPMMTRVPPGLKSRLAQRKF
jgi:GT2 family glycosyltransferase